MRYKLNQFPSISRQNLGKLAKAGFKDVDALLARTSLPDERKALSNVIEMPEEDLTRCSSMVDLARIKGVSPRMAEMLVESGSARNVQSFIEAMNQPQEVLKKLSSWSAQRKKKVKLPSPGQLSEMREEALELRPRLAFGNAGEGESFRRELIQRANSERIHLRRISFAFSGIVVAAVAILYGLSRYYSASQLREKFIPGDELNRLSVEVAKIMIDLNGSSLLLVFALLLVFMASLFVFYDWLSYLQDAWLALWLFNRPGHRKFYRRLKSIDLQKQVRGLWMAVGIFALLAIVLVILSYILLQIEMGMTDFAQAISWSVIFGGILLGVTASVPVIRFYQKDLRLRENLDSLRRYMVYYLAKVLTLPLMVVLLTQVAMPLAFDLHRQLYLEWIVPPARRELLENRSAIEELKIDSPGQESRRDEILDFINGDILPGLETFGVVDSGRGFSFEELYIPMALNMVVWTALTAYLLLFVVPYLILGGWKRGLFYILLLGIGLNTEKMLTLYSPTWFMLPKSSLGSFFLIAFFVFANALFFDWIYDELTSDKIVCLSCNAYIEKKSRFCEDCGFVQG